ncbi:hypothetical protein D3C73_910980 [compost metagenome]
MDKEIILEKSRQEKKDEGKEFIFNRGRKFGVIGTLSIFCILAVFNLYNNHQGTNAALLAVVMGYLGCESFGIYSITKKKMDLIKIILGSGLSLFFFIKYFLIVG